MPALQCPQAPRPSPAHRVPTMRSLSPAQRRLVEEFQRLNFGFIRNLQFRDGEPLFDPPFQPIRTIRLPGDNQPRAELGSDDFVLKREVVEFLNLLRELGSGFIEVIKIQHGLPVQVEVREVAGN